MISLKLFSITTCTFELSKKFRKIYVHFSHDIQYIKKHGYSRNIIQTGFIYIDSYFIVKEKSYIKSISDIFAFAQDGLYGNLFFFFLKC